MQNVPDCTRAGESGLSSTAGEASKQKAEPMKAELVETAVGFQAAPCARAAPQNLSAARTRAGVTQAAVPDVPVWFARCRALCYPSCRCSGPAQDPHGSGARPPSPCRGPTLAPLGAVPGLRSSASANRRSECPCSSYGAINVILCTNLCDR